MARNRVRQKCSSAWPLVKLLINIKSAHSPVDYFHIYTTIVLKIGTVKAPVTPDRRAL